MKKTTTKRRGGREENRTLWGDKIKQMKWERESWEKYTEENETSKIKE